MKLTNTSYVYQNQQFTGLAEVNPLGHDFTNCSFTGCDCSDLNFDSILDSCVFKDCNLSLTSFKAAKLQDVVFIDCKLMGVDFTQINILGLTIRFEQCLIRSCNFNFLPLPKTVFLHCDITETDFMGADLTGGNFNSSTFRSVTFHNTNLTKADFTGAQGYLINPLTNNIKNARFELPEAVSLLECMGVKLK